MSHQKIKLQNNTTVWFTSDTHYGHKNICRGVSNWSNPELGTRDFADLSKMNQAIVDNINNHVAQDDIFYHLGDWSFGGVENIARFREQIICKNIHLVLGNHDTHIAQDRENTHSLFSSVNHYSELTIQLADGDKLDLVLMHYPIQSWNGLSRDAIHLHGHVHLPADKKLGKGKMMDVGVDGNDLVPYSIQDICRIMAKQPVKSNFNFDHHE
jgi:calcineurin-like phosphoesterase family protein